MPQGAANAVRLIAMVEDPASGLASSIAVLSNAPCDTLFAWTGPEARPASIVLVSIDATSSLPISQRLGEDGSMGRRR